METSQARYGNPVCFSSHKSVVRHIIPQSFHLKALKLSPQILDSYRNLLLIYGTVLLLYLHQTLFFLAVVQPQQTSLSISPTSVACSGLPFPMNTHCPH